MKKSFVKVVAARRLMGFISSMPTWWLWLACGHITKREAKKIPRTVVCHTCQRDKRFGYRKKRDWKKGDIPDDSRVVRF